MAKKKLFSLDATQAWSLGGWSPPWPWPCSSTCSPRATTRAPTGPRASSTRSRQPTLETLHALDEQVEIWVLLGGGDPMEQNIAT